MHPVHDKPAMEPEMRQRLSEAMTRRRMLAAAMLGSVGVIAASARFSEAQEPAGPLMTRAIPRTGEALPVIGLGTARGWYSVNDQASRDALTAVVSTLNAAGGTIIDTAPSYGQAEAIVGDIVARAGLRPHTFLATKLEDYARATGQRQLQDSLRNLRTDKIDLMQLHNISDPHQDLGMMREWKAQGICRYIGITTTYHGDFAAAEAVLRREKPDFLEIDYSIEDREAEKRLLPTAAELGVAVLTAEPLGRGRLFGQVRQRPLPPWSSEFGASTWGQFFIKYVLGHPAVTAAIPGTANPAHMADNLGAGRGRPPTADEQRKMVEYLGSLG
jgi:aryl-alcohol dehydrogenase-like predicted oxidoreductase